MNSSKVSDNSLTYYWRQFWVDVGDHRTAQLPLIRDGPWLMFTIVFCYLLFVRKIGPNLMKSREPFELRGIMLLYNSAMVMTNAYFFIQSLDWLKYGSALFDFKFPTKDEFSPKIEAQIWIFYLYYISKFADLLDTIFFVMRKKYSQISTLHLYHHSAVVILGWMTCWFRFNVPSVALFALLNSFVHVVMYSYYALSAFGPKIQRYLWWKKYITQLQLFQFLLFGIYGSLVKVFHTGYPPFAFWLAFSQPPLFLYMFHEFYVNCYHKRK